MLLFFCLINWNFKTFQNIGGKLVVIGSIHMFTDQYIDKEENSKIWVIKSKYSILDLSKLGNGIEGLPLQSVLIAVVLNNDEYLQEVVIKYLMGEVELNHIDSSEPDLIDAHPIPDHINISDQIKVCLQEGDFEIARSGDFLKLFDLSLYSMDLSLWAKSIE